MARFEVRQDGRFLGYADRVVRDHSGWASVRYNGKRFQLFGLIRGPHFINVLHPLKSGR